MANSYATVLDLKLTVMRRKQELLKREFEDLARAILDVVDGTITNDQLVAIRKQSMEVFFELENTAPNLHL